VSRNWPSEKEEESRLSRGNTMCKGPEAGKVPDMWEEQKESQ
jgi:hypothetical protein